MRSTRACSAAIGGKAGLVDTVAAAVCRGSFARERGDGAVCLDLNERRRRRAGSVVRPPVGLSENAAGDIVGNYRTGEDWRMLTSVRLTRTRRALLAGFVGSLVLMTASAAGAGTGEVTLISTSSTGVMGNAGVLPLFSMSDDGSKVTFDSQSTNLVSPASSGRQAFVKDVPSGALTIVSARADGTYANRDSWNTALSHNGRYVTFNSQASNLDPAHGGTSSAVYMKDLATGALTLVSNGTGPAPVSDDGQTVVSQSGSGIVAKDLGSGTVTFLAGNASGTIFASISADGSKVAIGSQDPLLPNDTDSGRSDIYVRDMTTGSLRPGLDSSFGGGVRQRDHERILPVHFRERRPRRLPVAGLLGSLSPVYAGLREGRRLEHSHSGVSTGGRRASERSLGRTFASPATVDLRRSPPTRPTSTRRISTAAGTRTSRTWTQES